jgi:predicted nucleic acid-binding protein
MADFYLDSSAAAKRYVQEIGSSWVRQIFLPNARNTIYTARITGAEIVAALVSRQRGGTLAPSYVRRAIARFKADFSTRFALVEVSAPLVDHAMTLAETHGLRGYDAVQLAAGLYVRPLRRSSRLPLIFVSADARLNAAAAAEGLTVDDPNAHQ